MNILFSRKSKTRSQKIVILIIFTIANSLFGQQKAKDTVSNQLDQVLILGIRVTQKTPVSFSNLSKTVLQNRNLGQDIPVLMNFMPSVVTTSDAGNGFGYTGIRVRGSDASRINVTLNGVPYNDAESSGTYFVDMPDFASSLQSIQLQRGVGTSTNGSGAFGASINMLTQNYSEKACAEIANSFGSFKSHKHTLKFSTGLLKNRFEIAGRISYLKSDGYIDRASSNLKSYFFQTAFVGKKSLIKLLIFGGKERTYQSWNGVDANKINDDRTYNYSGIYFDTAGNIKFYNNEVDDYQQHHAQLLLNQKIAENWNVSGALHYTKGKGFYENYKEDAAYSSYSLTPQNGNTTTNLARQKWLNNDFYGTTFALNYTKNKTDFIFGGAYNQYRGTHYGLVNWAENIDQTQIGKHYYDYFGNKNDLTLYAKNNYKIANKWNFYLDLQYRNVMYKANGVYNGEVMNSFSFFNPKAGINYIINNQNTFYLSYAKANREPNRTDYENNTTNPEKLDDYELGWRHNQRNFLFNWNVYFMNYKNQILLTGAIDDVGNNIRFNANSSYRFGTEFDINYNLSKHLNGEFNTTLSANKIKTQTNTYDIAYSPNIIIGNTINIKTIKNVQLAVLQKFVGNQYLNNSQSYYAKLNDYFTTDFNFTYDIYPKKGIKKMVLNGLINNIFNKKYSSNGYMYDIYPYYFPQAGTNYLIGLTVLF